MRRPIALIAALARNRVIGQGNALPWRLASDMRHFKAMTLGKPVIMGRRTYQSIGRPLPGRAVVVVSSRADFVAAGCDVVASVGAAVEQAERRAATLQADEIMVAGGGTLYGALIGRADRLYLTEIEAAPAGDTLFPTIDPALWRETERMAHPPGPGDDTGYSLVTYRRR